jgi:hypothetical protein
MSIAIGLVVSLLMAQADPAAEPPPPPKPTAYKCEAADGSVAWRQTPCPAQQKELKAVLIPPDASKAKGVAPPVAKFEPLPGQEPQPSADPEPHEAPAPEEKAKPTMVYVPLYDMWVPSTGKPECEQIEAEAQRERESDGETRESTYERNRRRQELGC